MPTRIGPRRRLTAKESQTYYRLELGGREGETMRRHLHSSPLMLIALACLLLIATACASDEAGPASSAPARYNSYRDPATTIEEALAKARDVITAAPPHVSVEVRSVEYVETTYGQWLDTFSPQSPAINRSVVEVDGRWADDARIWAIVASGRFQGQRLRRVPYSPPPGCLSGCPQCRKECRGSSLTVAVASTIWASWVKLAAYAFPCRTGPHE